MLLDLHYNALNRYEQLDVNGVTQAGYQHNALGQRVKKVTPAQTIFYHYDEAGQLLAETDSQGNVIRDYIYMDAMRVARYEDTTPYYFHNDHLGRPVALTDAAGAIAWQVDYLPFGKVYTVVNNTTDNELGFPGQILDAESGFFYNYFRDYDPETGRYVQSDPLGLKGGINTYGYVSGNPQRFIDPYGLVGFGSRSGPFGPVCGSGVTATLIPDGRFEEACKKHDECYGECGKTKRECDVSLAEDGAAFYSAALQTVFRSQSEDAYDKAQEEADCDECD